MQICRRVLRSKSPYRIFRVTRELTREHRRKRRIADKRRLYVARKPKRRSRRARIPPRERVLRWSERYSRGIQMRRHESRSARIPTSSLELGHESRARARKLAVVQTTSQRRSFASQRDVRQDRVIARGEREGVLIKSKRPIRRCDKGAGLSTGGLVSFVPNTGAYIGAARDWAAIRCGLKTHGYECHAPRSFSLVTMSDQAWANSIRCLIWLTSCARNIRLWTVSPVYTRVLRLMATQRRISICFVVRLNDAERYSWYVRVNFRRFRFFLIEGAQLRDRRDECINLTSLYW